MEKDKLKKFVEEHRDEFDVFEPRPDMWQDISKELHAKKSPTVFDFIPDHFWRYAAAILFFVAVGWGTYQFVTKNDLKNDLAQTNTIPAVPLEKIAPEMAEVESYYTSIINQKREELSGFDLKALGIDDNLQQDIVALDSSYAKLKRELYSNPNKEQIIEAMIQNLRIRMEVLNQQIQMLNKIRKIQKNKSNEDIQT